LSKECVDIIEIDAASNNGVDEIRELKSKINIVPSYLKYKIYIIDEVHMLSIGAFNALLKTLEEPPAHAIFVLATTEIQKVPTTILSRCQMLEFKKISKNNIKYRIDYICKNEAIDIEDEAIDEIIGISDGCMRDALSFLEKINAYCNSKISLDDVRVVCGKISKQAVENFIDYVIKDDIVSAISKINEMYLNDYDLLYVAADIIEEIDKIIFEANSKEPRYQDLLLEMINIYDKMKSSYVNNKIIFEIGILNYFSSQDRKNISREIFFPEKNNFSSGQPKIEKESRDIEGKTTIDEAETELFDENKFKQIRINNTFAKANKACLSLIKKQWENLRNYAFNKENGAMVCSLLDGIPVAASDSYLILNYKHQVDTSKINRIYRLFEEIIKKYLSLSYNIVVVTEIEWNNAKQEYVRKMNLKESYDLIIDDYLIDEPRNERENKVAVEQNSNFINADEKVFELFDSEYIEIK